MRLKDRGRLVGALILRGVGLPIQHDRYFLRTGGVATVTSPDAKQEQLPRRPVAQMLPQLVGLYLSPRSQARSNECIMQVEIVAMQFAALG